MCCDAPAPQAPSAEHTRSACRRHPPVRGRSRDYCGRVNVEPLPILGAHLVTPRLFADERGTFLESFRRDQLESAVGHRLDIVQVNTSISARGVLRGVHFADVPKGQAKYVTVITGSIVDFVVDVRIGSPTFGQSIAVPLDGERRQSLYLAEGLGHAFLALEDDTTVNYLVTDTFRPEREHGINPLDPNIALALPEGFESPLLSAKDANAPTFEEAARQGLLPTWEQCIAHYASLKGAER